jgi:type II secretory pathway pseudopilin PulG
MGEISMKSRGVAIAVFFAFVLSCTGAAGGALPAARCEDHMRMIHQAIQQYRREKQELPANLSDLSGYISDPRILSCPNPIIRTTSAQRVGKAPDDRSTTYYYEFTLTPSSIPGKTERDFKSAQMSILGAEVPILRCFLHEWNLQGGGEIYNMSFGGRFYKSGLVWENNYTNLVNSLTLMRPPLLQNVRVVVIPPRPASADPRQIDLTKFYNASLTEGWLSPPEHHLKPLAPERDRLRPVAFDLRGVVQLSGAASKTALFPTQIKGLPIDRTCRKLHFLQGSAGAAPPATPVGKYIVHFHDGQSEEIPILYEDHVLDTWNAPPDQRVMKSQLAWEKQIENGPPIQNARLYRMSWKNPRPDARIVFLDFISAGSSAAPFLVGLSVEE